MEKYPWPAPSPVTLEKSLDCPTASQQGTQLEPEMPPQACVLSLWVPVFGPILKAVGL